MKVFVTQDYDLFDIFATREAAWKTLIEEFERNWGYAINGIPNNRLEYPWMVQWREIGKEAASEKAKQEWIEEYEVKE